MNWMDYLDLEGAEERFMSNEVLYKKFLFEFTERDLYDRLKEAISKNDAAEGFEVAHKLKGSVETIALNYLGERISPIVEILRNGNIPEQKLLDELEDAYQLSVQVVLQIKNENIQLFNQQ